MKKLCKNCGHEVRKRYFIKQGQSMWEWTHTNGGNYCKKEEYSHNHPYGKTCFCNQAELKIKEEKKDGK